MDDAADMDTGHRHEVCRATLAQRARDDVEHSRFGKMNRSIAAAAKVRSVVHSGIGVP